MNLINKMALTAIVLLLPSVLQAHEGMHAAAQTHIGESHMGIMEISLAVIAMVVCGIWALKEAKK